MNFVLVVLAKNISSVMVVSVDSIVHVAVGVIFNAHNEVLIAQRPPDKPYSGVWEFPGGKIEKRETIFQALQRELLEEVGIHVITAHPWLQVEHDYPERSVLLHTWRVTQFLGEAIGKEKQLIQWVSIDGLNQFEFAAGNREILIALSAVHTG
ncbi:MAG: Nudix family hydrolase [Gammaproteobacteria bacterium]|jgi:8-oxo-dGTP diphosphatase|nr:Nudix family hydrolase [Gammaproteobacteria bacterium]